MTQPYVLRETNDKRVYKLYKLWYGLNKYLTTLRFVTSSKGATIIIACTFVGYKKVFYQFLLYTHYFHRQGEDKKIGDGTIIQI